MWYSAVNAVGDDCARRWWSARSPVMAFEVYHSPGKDRLMGFLLLAIMIPFAATMIPLFQMFAQLQDDQHRRPR